jgi:hypothetical protein
MRPFWSMWTEKQAADLSQGLGDVAMLATFHLGGGPATRGGAERCDTLILVAGDNQAIFCCNADGISEVVGVLVAPGHTRAGPPDRGTFARNLVEALKSQIRRRAFDDLMILASTSMRDELSRLAGRNFANLLNSNLPVSHPTEGTVLLAPPHPRLTAQTCSVGCG